MVNAPYLSRGTLAVSAELIEWDYKLRREPGARMRPDELRERSSRPSFGPEPLP